MQIDQGDRHGRYRLPDERWVGATLRYLERGTAGLIADVYPDHGRGAGPLRNRPQCAGDDLAPGGCWVLDPPAGIGRRSS